MSQRETNINGTSDQSCRCGSGLQQWENISGNRAGVSAIYQTVAGNDSITMDIMIGYGQVSETGIYLSGRKLAGISGSQNGIYLGTNDKLKGKELVIQTLVHDIQKETNRTNVMFALRGGKQELYEDMGFEVQSDGEVVLYTVKVLFC